MSKRPADGPEPPRGSGAGGGGGTRTAPRGPRERRAIRETARRRGWGPRGTSGRGGRAGNRPPPAKGVHTVLLIGPGLYHPVTRRARYGVARELPGVRPGGTGVPRAGWGRVGWSQVGLELHRISTAGKRVWGKILLKGAMEGNTGSTQVPTIAEPVCRHCPPTRPR